MEGGYLADRIVVQPGHGHRDALLGRPVMLVLERLS
jgi:hypothetical protein